MKRMVGIRYAWLAATVAAGVLAVPSTAVAQDRSYQHDDNKHAENRVDARFNQQDREAVWHWYQDHKDSPPAGVRDKDRLNEEQDRQIQRGTVLDRQWHDKLHDVPGSLKKHLRPAPHGFEYKLIGGHLVMVDKDDDQIVDEVRVYDGR